MQMNISVKAPKAPPTMEPIGSSDFDFPCTKTVATPGVAPDVGLDEEDPCVAENDEEGDDKEDCDVVDEVLAVVGELDEVVRDDEGRIALLTKKKSRNNTELVWLLLYSMVNTWEASGRTGDWKSNWRHCVLPVSDSLTVSLTGVPPSML